MVSLVKTNRWLALAGWTGIATSLLAADPSFQGQGTEYPVSGGLAGDQTRPHLSINRDGGLVVWQDNAIDGDGLGIGAAALNNYLSPIPMRTFRVNENGTGDQENPVVQLLPEIGAVIVWQGGPPGQQDIWARTITQDGIFATPDFRVNTTTAGQQADPMVARLKDGGLVVVWSSYGQDGSMQGVFGQRITPAGSKLGAEFQVNQYADYNQRSPSVCTLAGGDFVVVWASEQQRFENSVDIYGRRYDRSGVALGNEFLVNAGNNVCANPVVCPAPEGGFLVAWSERSVNPDELPNLWDVVVRAFDVQGAALGEGTKVNEVQRGSQYGPQVAAVGNQLLMVWTSLRQDGSREGVFARFLSSDGALLGGEFRVNTTTISQQFQPAVASDGETGFLAVWSSFVGGAASFDIFGQRYASGQELVQPTPPMVSALDSYSVLVSWPALAGYDDPVKYRLLVGSNPTPEILTDNFEVVTDLDPGKTYAFRLAYELANGQISAVSEPATGTTWSRDRNFDGLPDDWQSRYWGDDNANWPTPTEDADGDGASNLSEFLAGTDPLEVTSVLRVAIRSTNGGLLVEWNAVPGSIYQLQSATSLGQWSDVGTPQFAAGAAISTVVPSASSAAYYRVIRVR